MEIKTCEQYVMNRLIEKENECEELKTEVYDLKEDIQKLQSELNSFKELFTKFCKHNTFRTTGTKEFSLEVYSGYDDDSDKWYKWLNERFPNLPGMTYGDNSNEEEDV